jgi:ribosomal protein L6P/L9E
VEVEPPNKETKIEIDKNQTHITVSGISKQTVGDLAAHIVLIAVVIDEQNR